MARINSTLRNKTIQFSQRSSSSSSHNFSKTLNLPVTPFPLRGQASTREKLFNFKTTKSLYDWQSQQKDRLLFILHDGPPYANGSLHIGHALNKILKDIINRFKILQGYRVHYLPGWDTHGLPLELKALAVLKQPARELSPQQIRAAARAEAERGIKLQRDEFREFGLLGEWDEGTGYRTMSWAYEKRQLGVVREMVRKGLITTHHRPTLYSPSSRTALAEAELEYKEDHVSRSVYVSFPVANPGLLSPVLRDLNLSSETPIGLSVWTTTAWTLPSNVAIAILPIMQYSLVRCNRSNQLLIMASERIAALEETLRTTYATLASFAGSDLLETTYSSVLSPSLSSSIAAVLESKEPNLDAFIATEHLTRPIISASYVTSSTGTGLVHTAPAHGVEDWQAWRSHCLAQSPRVPFSDVPCAVDGDGKFSNVLQGMIDRPLVERLKGLEVLGAGTAEVIQILKECGTLLEEIKIEHKFPYDWRTKKPVIFRATSQWFANLDKIKDDAIKALDDVKFYPATGAKRLELFVRGRSEWCISRQRAWGVPIPVVYSYPTHCADPVASSTPYLTPSNIEHIISVLDQHSSGTDYWWEGEASEFVEPEELARSTAIGLSWRKGVDTMDVWFDSGVSWSLIRDLDLRSHADIPFSDVYLEGSDQHRGWFQSSLLTAISASQEAIPRAPYGTVITHGMVLDERGRKMSKSLGNVISPLTVIQGGKKAPAYGVDVLRLWVASVESSRDVPIGAGILTQISDSLRKIRNTARFMIGNLTGEGARVTTSDFQNLGLIERYVLHELWLLDTSARDAYNAFAFNRIYQNILAFTNITLSSFYFDIVKDSLYADSVDSVRRQNVISTLQQVLETYTMVLAPIIPHLAEEIHHFSKGATGDPELGNKHGGTSVFEKHWLPLDTKFEDVEAKQEMESLLLIRDQVMNLMEKARTDKHIGSSTQVEVVLSAIRNHNDSLVVKHHSILQDLFIVSKVIVAEDTPLASDNLAWSYKSNSDGIDIEVRPASARKCPRCWTYTSVDEEVCHRCEGVLKSSVPI